MDFSFPPEAEKFRAQLRDWLAGHLTKDVVEAGHRGVADPDAFAVLREWNREMADGGWGAISWPVEYGGRGATVLEQLAFVEETVYSRTPLPINIIGLNNIAPAIMQFGTPAQKTMLLPRMMRADEIWCQGMSEPDAGSDLASLRTRAVRDGDDFVITGQKIWTSLGHRADWCQLFVRTDPNVPNRQGISCLLVDMTRPGVRARPVATLTGEAHFAEVFFDQVRVPADALLGPLHGGWGVATTTLSHERANAARLYTETRVRLHDLVADLAATDPDTLSDPLTLHRLGELDVRIGFLETLCKRAISAALHGGDAAGSASLAKTAWAELGQDVAALGFDLLGHTALGDRWSQFRLAARALTIAGGTTQVNKNITATRVLGLPRR